MNSREQMLSLVLLGAIVLTVAGAGGYFFIWEPLQKQRTAEAVLNEEIADLEKQAAALQVTKRKLDVARVRSLPADENLAKREYFSALERLIASVGVPKGYTVTDKKVDNSSRAVPELSKGKRIYTRVAYEIVLKKVDMWMLTDFLERYYQLGLLHQITNLMIKKDGDANSKKDARRNDLTVTIQTEAILVEGAENRRTLLPVPTAFAALGGGAIYKGMTVSPEIARGVKPHLLEPVLASLKRDYSLIVRKDPFSGPVYDPKPVPFKLAKPSDVKIKPDEKPDAVRFSVSGDGSVGAKVTALASGSLFAEGALKVELRTAGLYAIDLPKTSATEGTATISVIATSADGKTTEKTSFKVSLAEVSKVPVDLGEDLTEVIILIGVTPRSDGTAWARVLDHANRHRYQIEATPKGIKDVKESTYGPDRPWKPDWDHSKLPAGVMQLPAFTKMPRTFKVIAVDHNGLVIADLKPADAPKEVKKVGMGARPAKQGPANPVAAVGGNMIATAPEPKYYRWSVGEPLSGIKPLTDKELKEVLKATEATGPVLNVADGR